MVDKIIMEEDWVGEGGSISNCLGGGGASSAGNSLTHHWDAFVPGRPQSLSVRKDRKPKSKERRGSTNMADKREGKTSGASVNTVSSVL